MSKWTQVMITTAQGILIVTTGAGRAPDVHQPTQTAVMLDRIIR